MFKKKPNIKPLSPIRSSDRRKIADQIISLFGIVLPNIDGLDNDQNNQNPPTLTVTSVRNSLLPEGSLSARFTTTVGPDLSPISGTVYVGAHAGNDPRILWIKVGDRLIPTVYTLWKHPQLVPLLHTPHMVLQKLQSGADLMTPGLARGPPFPSKAVKDSVVAIASIENPSVPRVVGFCEIDVASLGEVHGVKGHAVKGFHWEGDEIWSWGQGGKSGEIGPKEIEGWDINGENEKLRKEIDSLSLNDSEDGADNGGVPTDSVAKNEDLEASRNEFVEGESLAPVGETKAESKTLSTKEIDRVFWDAFLFGAYDHRKHYKNDPNHGLIFPMPQSLVISNLTLPYLPIFSQIESATLNIKKTSWKNAKKFIKALDKQKILKSKDRDGGETFVIDINFDDAAITEFVPYEMPKKETKIANDTGENIGNASSSRSDDSVGQRLKRIHLFRPKEQLSPIFEASKLRVKDLYSAGELRPVINSYVESENLISATKKHLVTMNPILANALFDSASSLDHEVLTKGSVPRDALIERFMHSCSPFWVILRNDDTRDTVKAKPGLGPKVQLTYETRSGNKTVTKISGLEVFHLNPHLLADELQKTCASSTSVNQLMGSSPKNPVQEILVQGPQKDAVFKALEMRGVHKNWVDFVSKVKGGKK